MKILVVNCGSSSIKYQLIDMENEQVMAKGLVERIGIPGSVITHRPEGKDKVVIEAEMKNHTVGIKYVIDCLTHPEYGVIKDMKEIDATGHRVAHGGELFSEPELVDQRVFEGVRDLGRLAPLHNPASVMGIEATEEALPGVPMVTVFDTAFHQTMPPKAFLYGIPYNMYKDYAIRSYGFHGTSHKYVAETVAKEIGKPIEDLKIITCHLGNGASITAVDGGKSVDTSMGFTPLGGLIMGTRCGDMDPAVVPFIMEKEGFTPEDMNQFMNKKCGVEGISGVSSDFRDVEEAANNGNERARYALDMFIYRVQRYIGAYTAAMNGLDVLVFTAGIGENSITMREEICKNMDFFGITIDPEKNNIRGEIKEISQDSGRVKVYVVPTNEELMIARETKAIVEKLGK